MNHCDTKMQSSTAGVNYLKEDSNTSSEKKLHPQKMTEVSGLTPTTFVNSQTILRTRQAPASNTCLTLFQISPVCPANGEMSTGKTCANRKTGASYLYVRAGSDRVHCPKTNAHTVHELSQSSSTNTHRQPYMHYAMCANLHANTDSRNEVHPIAVT